MANRRWRMRFHSDAGPVCLLGARYPLASLFSSLDVRRYHCVGSSQKLVGVFHWVLSRWAVDLRKYFATTFFFNGLQQLSQWVHTGHLERADLLIAVPAWFSNLLVVIGCVWGYFRVPTQSLRDAGRFLVTFALTTGFFALDMALFQPRYLGLFPRMLHPHLP
jgi:hypothetical protein